MALFISVYRIDGASVKLGLHHDRNRKYGCVMLTSTHPTTVFRRRCFRQKSTGQNRTCQNTTGQNIACQNSVTPCRGFTVLELLVTISIVTVLLAILLPAVMSCREAARLVQCKNNLHQIGLAVHLHHDAFEQIPFAWKSVAGQEHQVMAWAQQLLPFLEQSSLSEHSLTDWQSHLAVDPSAASLDVFLCPSDITVPSFELTPETDAHTNTSSSVELSARIFTVEPDTANSMLLRLPTANYIGVYGTVEADEFDTINAPEIVGYGDGSIVNDRRICFADLRRGLSHTIVIGERTMAMVPSTWLGVDLRGEDAACRITGSAMTSPNCEPCDECEFSSRHPGGSSFLYADGRVGIVTDSIDQTLYRELARRNP